jgi:hypothetical protein
MVEHLLSKHDTLPNPSTAKKNCIEIVFWLEHKRFITQLISSKQTRVK